MAVKNDLHKQTPIAALAAVQIFEMLAVCKIHTALFLSPAQAGKRGKVWYVDLVVLLLGGVEIVENPEMADLALLSGFLCLEREWYKFLKTGAKACAFCGKIFSKFSFLREKESERRKIEFYTGKSVFFFCGKVGKLPRKAFLPSFLA